MTRRVRISAPITAVVVLSLLTSAVAFGHHPERFRNAEDLFPGEGVAETADKQQHGGTEDHLPPVSNNVNVVGKAEVSNPSGSAAPRGRVADVSAYGNYAYLTAFRSDNCLGGGAWIVDISDPANPVELSFLPTTPGSYAGEGSQVINVKHGPYAGRQLFIHQNEIVTGGVPDCGAIANAAKPAPNRGGINIWDVTDPHNPELLVEHAGDFTPNRVNPNNVHSVFAWNSHVDQKVYAVLVDNVEFTDVDIMDITDPENPVMVNDTLDLFTVFGIGQDNPPDLQAIFNHDMMVFRKGDRYIMNVNYWDGGYVLLDVTNPTPGNVTLVTNWEFPEFDDEAFKRRGEQVPPGGNAHQSELSPDANFMIGTDEIFDPFFTVAMITSGPFAGFEFTLANASGTPSVGHHDEGTGETLEIEGPTTWVGLACTGDPIPPAPAEGGTALISRGVCAFQEKLDNIVAAGYTAGIVFNSAIPGCNGLVTMLAEGDIPFVFVAREVGLKILGIDAPGDAACTTPNPPLGTPSADVSVESHFRGWGYVRLFRTKLPGEVGSTGSITQLETYSIDEAQDPEFTMGFGDLTVHEVAMDPRPGTNLAYLSYYAGGFRVLEYGNKGLKEVGAFIDQGGNNFWGVEVHRHPNGQYYVLASDRDFGLYIFQYAGKIAGGSRGGADFFSNMRP